MASKYSVKHKLSLTAISDLLELIHRTIDSSILPESRYMIDKILNPKDNVHYHALCSNCHNYLGSIDVLPDEIECTICKESVNVSNPSCPCYFAMIDPSERIALN